MTTTLLAYAPGFAIAGLLFLAASLCGRLERWHTRREAAVAKYNAGPRGARVGTAEQDAAAIAHQAIREGWTDPTTEERAA